MPAIKRLLIANRGEIACRIIATARKMGIETVAVYSDADRNALHTRRADSAIRIGPAPSTESYLDIPAVIDAAKKSRADAIHPGYGFLSENTAFASAVEKAGIIFVGPPAKAIKAMGLKDAAKKLMEKAGVPVVPGYHGDDQKPATLKREAEKIGYPVFIKARAGGGGKGMRLVESADDFAEALGATMREAAASFGDDCVLIEKAIRTPRHVEVQIFADSHGNVVHLYERDCSLQRRHQKVIEEAPAPGIDDATRKAMTDAAISAAKAIGYRGAGTVEFIADGSKGLAPDGFWFMEMNTRLQVEHPVTEAITELDLVEWQLRVAAGENLPLSQDTITINGHSAEVRLYAEDPARGFLPCPGRINALRFPSTARIDSGVETGDIVSAHYDPMIAKIISHGATREEALANLGNALGATHVHGLKTNLDFLSTLAGNDDFAQMKIDTGWIDRNARLAEATTPEFDIIAKAAVLAAGNNITAQLANWQNWGRRASHITVQYGDDIFRITLTPTGDGITAKGENNEEATVTPDESLNALISDSHVSFTHHGKIWCFGIPDPLNRKTANKDSGGITAPMTGVVRDIKCKKGDAVKERDALIALEAMKMEHTITAPRDGIIGEISCAVGDTVSDGAILVTFEEHDDGR